MIDISVGFDKFSKSELGNEILRCREEIKLLKDDIEAMRTLIKQSIQRLELIKFLEIDK